MTFKEQLRRIFCGGCTLYVEKSRSCCYVDGSGRNKFCRMVIEKTDELFKMRSPEGYRLAIVDDNAKLPENSYHNTEDLSPDWVCEATMNAMVIGYGYVKEIKE